MALFIRNSTPNTVSVAIGYPNKGCSPYPAGRKAQVFGGRVAYHGGLAKRGWYNIPAGRTVQVYGGRVAGHFFYVHAHDSFGNVWGGDDFTDVPRMAFDMCWIARCKPGTTCRRRGFDVHLFRNGVNPFAPGDGTIEIYLTRSQRTSKSRNIRILLPSKRKSKTGTNRLKNY